MTNVIYREYNLIMKDLSFFLAEKCQDLGMSKASLSRDLGIDPGSLYSYFSGSRKFPARLVEKIIMRLEMTDDDARLFRRMIAEKNGSITIDLEKIGPEKSAEVFKAVGL